MKKIRNYLAGIFILGGLLASCSFTGTYFPTKKTIPDGTYVCEEPTATTGYYKKLLDGVETLESLDTTIRRETLTIKGNTLHYVLDNCSSYEKVDADSNSYVTLEEPVVENISDLTGTYTIYTDDKIMFDIEGDTYVFQNGSYFEYEQNGDEIKFVKKAILDGSYILGPFKKQ